MILLRRTSFANPNPKCRFTSCSLGSPAEALAKAGGDGGNRTRVRKQDPEVHYVRSQSIILIHASRQTGITWTYPDSFLSATLRRGLGPARLSRRAIGFPAGTKSAARAALRQPGRNYIRQLLMVPEDLPGSENLGTRSSASLIPSKPDRPHFKEPPCKILLVMNFTGYPESLREAYIIDRSGYILNGFNIKKVSVKINSSIDLNG
jgi:hypothetical protein